MQDSSLSNWITLVILEQSSISLYSCKEQKEVIIHLETTAYFIHGVVGGLLTAWKEAINFLYFQTKQL